MCVVPCRAVLCCAVQDVSLKLLLDAARGIACMHEVDVVHGDVKSRNLLVVAKQRLNVCCAVLCRAVLCCRTSV
jgi:tRNA A-37 threonylcarbamoyl transferase component Bud32